MLYHNRSPFVGMDNSVIHIRLNPVSPVSFKKFLRLFFIFIGLIKDCIHCQKSFFKNHSRILYLKEYLLSIQPET
jgi:hypothetical protein